MTLPLQLTWADLGDTYDGPHATPQRVTSGPYFLNISSLSDGRLDLAQSDHVSAEEFTKWTRRVTPHADDLLFSYETRLGEAALMPDNVEACLGRRMALLRPNRDVVHPKFLLYYYLSPAFQQMIEQNTIHGATVNRISLSAIGKWPVTIPPIKDQQAIAEVLSALDAKIAANTELIASTDSLAQTQFQAALHDSHPKPLSSLAQFVNGKAFTKGASGTGRVVVRIAELNSGIGNSTVFSDAEVDEKHVVRPGDILFAWSGSLTLHRWFRDEAIVNQHIFKVIPNGETPDWLIYELLRNKLEDFKMIAADKATTMGHIQRKHLDEPVLVPNETILREIAQSMDSLWRTALNTERENLTLAAARDALLPKLMSGKLHIKEAEALVAASI